MKTNVYTMEINDPKVQKYIDLITTKYAISKDKVKKMLVEERAMTRNMSEAIAAVDTRIKFIMI